MDAVPLSDGEPAGPQPLTEDEVARYVVTAAVWAPSVHNTQPWRFTARGQQISLCADDERQLRVADPDGREMMISCGAALFTARLALRSLGYLPETCLLPDLGEPLLVARVSWQRRVACTEFEQQLFGQVRQRRTHRGGFDLVPLPPGLLTALRQGAARYGAMLRVVADDGRRAALAAAVETAEHAQQFESERVRELARWAPPPDSARADGVPPTSYPARAEHTDPDFPGRDFAHGRGWGLPPLSTVPPFRSAGVAALLTTARDRPADWINAGQALQRILLTASTCGIAAALHTQPLELGWFRDSIRTRLSDGAYPQLVLRFGAVIQAAASVRRPPEDVLSESGSEAPPPPQPLGTADALGAVIPPEARPRAESLRDVTARLLPYWYDAIVSDLRAGACVLVVSHGNTLRALVKHLDAMPEERVAELDIPTGVPLACVLRPDMRPVVTGGRYLGSGPRR